MNWTKLLVLAPLLLSGCAANKFYEAALKYEASRPVAALEYYKACLEVDPQHEQARPRFDSQDFYASFVASADSYEANGDYVGALGVYDQLVDLDSLIRGAGGPPAPVDLISKRAQVIKRASRQKFTEGEELRAAGEAKDASKAYRAAVAYDPRNAEAKARYREERAKATQRVAVLPFECKVRRFKTLANELSDRMVAKAIAGQPEFLQFVDRSHLDDLLDEHDLNASGLIDQGSAAATGKILGLHAMVYGTLVFECTDSGWIEQPGENTVILRHDDGQGGFVEETISATWVVYTRQTQAKATGGYQVISVESGAILAAQDGLSHQAVDEVRYARLTGGRQDAVPSDVYGLLNAAAREPRDPNGMVKQLVKPLSVRLADKLLRQFR